MQKKKAEREAFKRKRKEANDQKRVIEKKHITGYRNVWK